MTTYSRTLRCPPYDQLLSKRRTKSPVWAHFGLPADSSGKIVSDNMVICKYCKIAVSSRGGSTTNLFCHLKLHHPVHFLHLPTEKLYNLTTSAANVENTVDVGDTKFLYLVTESTESNDQMLAIPAPKKQKTFHDSIALNPTSADNCTLSIAKFIAITMQPYNIIEHEAFIEMLKSLNAEYELPDQEHFSQNAIPKLYDDAVVKVKSCFSNVNTHDISVTLDCWTVVIQYIAISCHFIDQEWELRSFCLRCANFEENQSSEDIADGLKSLLAEWEINVTELASCTTDNEGNALQAVSFFKVPHVPCFGYSINVGVKRALELPQLKQAITRLKKLQSTIALSWKMKADLMKAQELLQMDVVELPGVCPATWWSTLELCCSFLENQLPVSKLLEDYPTKMCHMLDSTEISVLDDFVAATEILKVISSTLSGEEYLTASSILPLYRKIKKALQFEERDSDLKNKIKFEILSPFMKIYEAEPLQSMLRMSSLCDPRFRLNFTDSSADIKETALEHLMTLYALFDVSSTDVNEYIVTPKKGLSKLLEDEESLDESTTKPRKKAEMELSNYLAMPKVSLGENPFSWWKSHENTFPNLKILAKKYLAIQGTCVPSECVFNAGGNYVFKHRASLSPKNAEMLVFLAKNKSVI